MTAPRNRGDHAAAHPAASASGGTPALRGRQRGFSLVEVVVALAVLAIGALAVARSMGTALAFGTYAGEQTRATALAVDRLEYLKSQPASNVVDESPVTIDENGQPDADGAYTRSVTVKTASEGARPNTKEVTVRVEFQAGERGRRAVEIFTILFVNDS